MRAPRDRRRSAPTFTTSPAPAVIGALLRDAGFLGCQADPITCRATFDAEGKPRRVKARYPGGWNCRLTLHRDGTYSLTQSLTVTLRGKGAA